MLSRDELINRVWISRQDMIDSFATIKELSEQNHPVGQAYLGTLYRYGHCVEKNLSKSIESYRASAKQGHPLGLVLYGVCYEFGIEVEQDLSRAAELYRASADQGHPCGQAFLGLCYEQGIGVVADLPKAVELYKSSAAKDHPVGQTYLAFCLEIGTGIGRDKTEADRLLRMAADRGHSPAQAFMGRRYLNNGNIPEAIECFLKAYKFRDRSFGQMLAILPHLSHGQLLELYETALRHNIPSHIAQIGEHLKRYQKSKNYIKMARLIMAENNNDDDCSICYEKIDLQTIYLTSCLHYFHSDCVKGQNRCPLCRAQLEELNCYSF